MSMLIQKWISDFNREDIENNIHGRDIFVWGAYSTGYKVVQKLIEQGLDIKGYIDAHKKEEQYCGLKVFSPDTALQSDVYVIVAIEGIRDEIIRSFNKYSKIEDEDYFYITNHIPDVTISSIMGHYEDCYGNMINTKDRIEIPIRLVGYNNVVSIGKGCKFALGTSIYAETGGKVEIGNDVITLGKIELETLEGGTLIIGNNNRFMEDSKISARTSSINFGHYTTCGKNMFILSAGTSPVAIGDDCMISNDVSIMSSSGHSVIDLDAKENISKHNEQHVIIGNHVWIGKSAIILYNSEIGSGSMVGAGSVVKNVFDENTVLCGNPAKTVAENRTWDRRRYVEFEQL